MKQEHPQQQYSYDLKSGFSADYVDNYAYRWGCERCGYAFIHEDNGSVVVCPQCGLSAKLKMISTIPVNDIETETPTNLVDRVYKNMMLCGSHIGSLDCVNGHHHEEVNYSCGIRICDHPECVRKRSANARNRLEKYMVEVPNLTMFYFTLRYTKFDFVTQKDVVKVVKKLRSLCGWMNRVYSIENFLVNLDVVKKPDSKYHLHFNVAASLPKELFDGLKNKNRFSKFANDVYQKWGYGVRIDPKRSVPQRKSTLGYFVKRIAEMNPPPKHGTYLKMSVTEYVALFYHFRFIRKWIWNKKNGNIVTHGQIMKVLSILHRYRYFGHGKIMKVLSILKGILEISGISVKLLDRCFCPVCGELLLFNPDSGGGGFRD